MELGEEVKVWMEIASSEERMVLIKTMIKEDLAFTDLEHFGENFSNKLKSIKLKNTTLYRKVSGPAMRAKLADEQSLRRELIRVKIMMKKKLSEDLEGEKTRGYRRVINYLNKVARDTKMKLREKYKQKLEHLRQKRKKEKDELGEEVPEDMEEYANLSVFQDKKYEEIGLTEYEVKTIGEVTISKDEEAVLRLHTKFSVLEDLRPGGLDANQEASMAKLRMEKDRDSRYKDFTDEERKKDEEIEATNRMIYNNKDKILDNRKRRVTDLQECARVTLPRPLGVDEEAKIEVRKRTHKAVYDKYRKEHTNNRGEQKTNLTEQESRGLKSLQERIKKEEIVVLKTDKSGKFVVTTPERYEKMGREHTDKDEEVSWERVRELERKINSHTIAWNLIWNTGDDHGHRDRVITSRATRSGNQAGLTLLYKDHKQGEKTRPVAGGNESYNLGLSNGLSEIMESVAKAIQSPYSVISSEDLLARISQFNRRASATAASRRAEERRANSPPPPEKECHEESLEGGAHSPPGEDLHVPQESIQGVALVGSDVVALYPSLSAERTAKIVKNQIIKSRIKFEGFDTKKALAYLKINEQEIQDPEEISHLLPTRKAKTGTTPTMSSITKSWDPENQWIFTRENLTQEEERIVVAKVVELALMVLFLNFTYKFGGKSYHQKKGGPIGVRATGGASQLVMEDWGETYRRLLLESGLEVFLLSGYVDDGRQITSILRHGMRYNVDEMKFTFSEEAKEMDDAKMKAGETANMRMARVCLDCMNSINPDLSFTVETQEEFQNERLPTLDFEMWLTGEQVSHSYFQKPMKTPLVIMERSGMSSQQKYQILANDLTRRLSNILVDSVEKSEIESKIEQYITELKNSGYCRKQAREIICSGIRGWRNKFRKRKRANEAFYRLAEDTEDQREKKKLLEKESWYKGNNDENEEEEEHPKKVRIVENVDTVRKLRKHRFVRRKKENVKTVIFVPHTTGSGLAKELRKSEEKMKEITGDAIKIVEKSGRKLEDILAGKDPWKGRDCGRQNCFLCSTKMLTGKQLNKDCTKRNILYEIRCLSCEEKERNRIIEETEDEKERKERLKKIKVPRYVGESSRSAYERGWEHLDKVASLSSGSHMLRHMVMEHKGEDMDKVKWGMFITKYLRTAFERQIEEAVEIEKESESEMILNSKSEYGNSTIPRLVTRNGNKEIEMRELEKEMKVEKAKDEAIEKEIRELRKERNRGRLITEKNGADEKRRKIEEEKFISIRKIWGPPPPAAPEKRKESEIKETEKKKRKVEIEIGEKITNLRTVENAVIEGSAITDFEIEIVDWEKVLQEHQERVEKETKERQERIKKKEIKEKSWHLMRLCNEFLERNEKNWEKERKDREIERKRQDRLQVAKEKQEEIRQKVKERQLEKDIEEGLKKIPTEKRKEMIMEEERKERIELVESKKRLWSLRKKEKKINEKSDDPSDSYRNRKRK